MAAGPGARGSRQRAYFRAGLPPAQLWLATIPGAGGRVFGQSSDTEWTTSIGGPDFQLEPKFDGHIWGLQAGLDLLGRDHDDGSQDRIGLFYTHTEASGDAIGNTLAQLERRSGKLEINSNGLGAYWTHIGSTGWYEDAVGMVTWFDGEAVSDLGIGAEISGNAILASLEGGYPFALESNWTLEPQAQLLWQRIDLRDTRDPFSSIEYEAFDTLTGRVGVRMEGNRLLNGMPVQPFIDVNLWHNFSSDYTVEFNDRTLRAELNGTWLELGGGLSAQFSENVSAYGALHYTTGLDNNDNEGIGGNIGLRVRW